MSQNEVYCNEVECLQVTIDRKYLPNRKTYNLSFQFYYMKKWIEIGVVIKQFTF